MQKIQNWSDREKSGRSTANSPQGEPIIAEEAMPRKTSSRIRRLGCEIQKRARKFGRWYISTPWSHLLTCFALPAALMILIYSFNITFPTGPSSVLVLDLNGQYVYFFEALRDWVWGEGSLL